VARILVVDDEQSMREFLGICLRRAGHEVAVARTGSEALEHLRAQPIDVVVSDLKMPGEVDGLGLLQAIKSGAIERAPVPGASPSPIDPEVILVTAFATTDTAIAAMKRGAYDYLTKPFQVDEINAVIGRALEKRALVEDNLALRDQLAGRARLAQLLGKSRAMQKVFELITKIHSVKTSVLITGESGTGKELVARALHSEGVRAKAPFVAVNCGAIPEELMESELFGHKRGSFTGAIADKLGMFQQADGGSLFLDEIGELSLGLQVKLLRALQEREIRRVGENRSRRVDVRVVAATNRDLAHGVAGGGFRQDLYYRLKVVELHVPPLRERRDDILPLARVLLADAALRMKRKVSGVMPATADQLLRYGWPGNVRELENSIERAVLLCPTETIEPRDLPARVCGVGGERRPGAELPTSGLDLRAAVEAFENDLIRQALTRTGWNKNQAAQLLGLNRTTLVEMLKRKRLSGRAA